MGILLPATIYYHLRQNMSRYPLCTFVVFYLFHHTGSVSFFHPPARNPKKRKLFFVVFSVTALIFPSFFRFLKSFCSKYKIFRAFLIFMAYNEVEESGAVQSKEKHLWQKPQKATDTGRTNTQKGGPLCCIQDASALKICSTVWAL